MGNPALPSQNKGFRPFRFQVFFACLFYFLFLKRLCFALFTANPDQWIINNNTKINKPGAPHPNPRLHHQDKSTKAFAVRNVSAHIQAPPTHLGHEHRVTTGAHAEIQLLLTDVSPEEHPSSVDAKRLVNTQCVYRAWAHFSINVFV